MKKTYILLSLNLILVFACLGQCTERDSLWNRLIFLRDGGTAAPASAEQLEELLKGESLIQNCPYKFDSTHAMLLQRIGVVYFTLLDFENARKYVNRSIDVININIRKPNINPGHLIRSYYVLSRICDSLGRSTEKVKAFDSCISVSMRIKSVNIFCLRALYSKLEYYINIGDYFSAIDCATRCESYALEYAKLGTKDQVKEGESLASLSFDWKMTLLIKSGRFDESQSLYLKRIKDINASTDKSDLGTLYNLLGEISIAKGNYKEALDYFQMAFQYDRNAGLTLGCKQILNNIGYFIYYGHLKDYKKALNYYRKALSINSTVPGQSREDSIENMNILVNIANVYVRQSNFDSAITYFRLSFNQIGPGANERNLTYGSIDELVKAGKVIYLTSLFIDFGDAFLHQYRATKNVYAINEAIRIYKLTIQFLNKIKFEQSELKSRLYWRADTRVLYEHAIEACYESGNVSDAFYFIELSRAVLLNDQLNEQQWLNADERSRIARVKKKINEDEREYEQIDKSLAKAKELENNLFESKNELTRLLNSVQAKNTRYYKSFLDTNAITIPEIRKKVLSNHQGLVECFLGDSTVYSMVITSDTVVLNKIDKILYDSLSRLYLFLLSDPERLSRKFDLFISVSSGLYNCIFPAWPLPAGRIIVSTDGVYFPYEALVTSVQPLTYLLENNAISYTYSSRYLLNNFSVAYSKSRDFLGIAPVKYPSSMQLANLSGSELSLDRIKANFGQADNLISNDASKDNFNSHYYNYRIVQLYTHASATSRYSEPIFWFADSAMYLSELISEQIPQTRLIVLSACETGKGQLFIGEGIFSFNRGFASLGIPSSVANLWVIEDLSNYRITELFYQYLSKGLPIDVSLQMAKKEFIKTAGEKKLPYFWSASVLVGKTDAIEFNQAFPWLWIIGATLIAMIFIAAILFKRKSN